MGSSHIYIYMALYIYIYMCVCVWIMPRVHPTSLINLCGASEMGRPFDIGVTHSEKACKCLKWATRRTCEKFSLFAWCSAKRAGAKQACPNKVMSHMWFMHDAQLGRAFLFLDILAEHTLLSMTVTVAACILDRAEGGEFHGGHLKPVTLKPVSRIFRVLVSAFSAFRQIRRAKKFATLSGGKCRAIVVLAFCAQTMHHPKNLLRLFFRNNLARQKITSKNINRLARLFLCLF